MYSSYLYSTRIEKSFDEDQEEILQLVKNELSRHPSFEVRLINYYKGLPVSYPAQVIGVDRDNLELDLYPQQAVALSTYHYTFIRSKLFKHDIFANVQYVNVKKRAASLRKLSYVEIMAEKRNYLRLELEAPHRAAFVTNEGVVKGNLIEISIIGAGVEINQPCTLKVDDSITLMFMLHNTRQNLNYSLRSKARLVGINGDMLPRYYRFAISPDKNLDRQIAQYIFQRQIDIIRELKEAAE